MIRTFIVFIAVWLVFTQADWASLVIGIPTSLAAAWSYRKLRYEPILVSFSGLLRFFPFFIYESLKGGWDVLSRLLKADMGVKPGFIFYELKLQSKTERMLFSNCICLLPGTLAADIQDDLVKVHVLDTRTDPSPELEKLEQTVAALFAPMHSPGNTP